jgi:diguanylate cyclase (GGDEF)-like protein
MSVYSVNPDEARFLSDNLERLRISHVRWLKILNKQLICNVLDDSFKERHTECDFGRWYYAVEIKEVTADEEFVRLGDIHRKLHDSASNILRRHRQGNAIGEEEYTLLIALELDFIHAFDGVLAAVNSTRYSIDTLTKLPNRGLFLSMLEKELAKLRRVDARHTLTFIDIDDFKQVNDRLGHQAGDLVLKAVADQLSSSIRTYDSVGRYGGEEFLVFLPDTDLVEAGHIMERTRRRIENLVIDMSPHEPVGVTCSFGLSKFGKETSLAEIIDEADRAMYSAKENGRNRVEVFQYS